MKKSENEKIERLKNEKIEARNCESAFFQLFAHETDK